MSDDQLPKFAQKCVACGSLSLIVGEHSEERVFGISLVLGSDRITDPGDGLIQAIINNLTVDCMDCDHTEERSWISEDPES